MISRIVFRADAGPAIGSGHVTRSLALASAFMSGGWEVGFAATKETFDTVKALKLAGPEKLVLGPTETEATTLAARWPDGTDILVVDHYGRDISFERKCRPWAKRILVIDDLADRSHDCDILADSNASSDAKYQKLVPENCRLLVGPSFAPLRSEFRRARAAALARRTDTAVGRVLVSFGQIDSINASGITLDILQASGYAGAIDVVLGGAAPHLAAIRKRTSERIKLHVDAPNMSELMIAADIAIGAGGTTSWERCCLGLPSLMLELAANQRGVIAAIEAANAGISLARAEDANIEKAANLLRGLLADGKKRERMAKAGAALVDGRGAERIMLAVIGSVVAKTGREVGLRLMETREESWLLDLQKKPETRKFSNIARVPAANEHAEWFSRALDNSTILLTTIESDGTPVGMLRFDREGEAVRVSIAIDPAHYRQGIGIAALALAERVCPGQPLDAEVKPENSASLALFSAAGYRHRVKDLYRREPS